MDIIISGASGFIGRRLAARLRLQHPHARMRCLVKSKEDTFGREGVDFLRSQSIQPIPTELAAGHGLKGLEAPNLVFHLAANTHTWEPNHDCNDLGTRNLLNALKPLGPRTHVIFTSTTAVMDNRNSFSEPLQPSLAIHEPPLSRYGASKWRAEQFLRSESKLHGFALTIVRLCTVYGAHPRPNTLFSVLKHEVARGSLASRLNWPGLTSFVHVEDVVTCLLQIGNNPAPRGSERTYLLATESATLADVSRLLHQAHGLRYRPVYLPAIAWKLFSGAHFLCRRCGTALPSRLHHLVWRFNIAVNPVFHCDTGLLSKWFPELKPRRLADSVGEI